MFILKFLHSLISTHYYSYDKQRFFAPSSKLSVSKDQVQWVTTNIDFGLLINYITYGLLNWLLREQYMRIFYLRYHNWAKKLCDKDMRSGLTSAEKGKTNSKQLTCHV